MHPLKSTFRFVTITNHHNKQNQTLNALKIDIYIFSMQTIEPTILCNTHQMLLTFISSFKDGRIHSDKARSKSMSNNMSLRLNGWLTIKHCETTSIHWYYRGLNHKQYHEQKKEYDGLQTHNKNKLRVPTIKR